MGIMKQILCSDWLRTRDGKTGPSCTLGIARIDPAQENNCVERTMSALKLPKAAEEDSGGFNVLKT